MGWLSVLVAIVNSMTMPAFGFLIGNLMFVIIEGRQSPTFVENRNYWINFGVVIMVVSATVAFIQKWLFSLAGEGLTLDVRQ